MGADGFMDIHLRSMQIKFSRIMNSLLNIKNLQQGITYRQRDKFITILNMMINDKSSIQRKSSSWEDDLLPHRITLPLIVPQMFSSTNFAVDIDTSEKVNNPTCTQPRGNTIH